MELKFEVKIKIQKPVNEVFDAVHDPEKLSGYFTNGGSSGPLDEGATVTWKFDDNPGDQPVEGEVKVIKVIPNEHIAREWMDAADHMTRTEFNFEKAGASETVVRIAETGWEENQSDLDRSYGNCFGWSQMICSLKAYLEYGINLRKGAFGGLYKTAEHRG
jgi:uncharacterized protein YndB with AHSA1/START domain